MCFVLMSEGRRFPENAPLIYELGFGRGLRELALYLTKLNNRGVVRIPDPDWAAMKLFGIVMPPLPTMCAGFAPIIIPPVEEVRTSVCVFLRALAQLN